MNRFFPFVFLILSSVACESKQDTSPLSGLTAEEVRQLRDRLAAEAVAKPAPVSRSETITPTPAQEEPAVVEQPTQAPKKAATAKTEDVCYFIPDGFKFQSGYEPDELRTNCATGRPLDMARFEAYLTSLKRRQQEALARMEGSPAPQQQQLLTRATVDGPTYPGEFNVNDPAAAARDPLAGMPVMGNNPQETIRQYQQSQAASNARVDANHCRALCLNTLNYCTSMCRNAGGYNCSAQCSPDYNSCVTGC